MSILIKGMEMPKEYAVIIKIYPDGRIGKIPYVQWFKTDLIEGVQAVPVPPHARIGDLDELKERVTKRLYASNHGSMAEAYFAALIDLTDTAPTVIEAEEGET